MFRLLSLPHAIKNVFDRGSDHRLPESPGVSRIAAPAIQQQSRTGAGTVQARKQRSAVQEFLNSKARSSAQTEMPAKAPSRKLRKEPPSAAGTPEHRNHVRELDTRVRSARGNPQMHADSHAIATRNRATELGRGTTPLMQTARVLRRSNAPNVKFTDAVDRRQQALKDLAQWVRQGDADVAARLEIHEYISNRRYRPLPDPTALPDAAAGASMMRQTVLRELAQWVQQGSDADVAARLEIYESIANRQRPPAVQAGASALNRPDAAPPREAMPTRTMDPVVEQDARGSGTPSSQSLQRSQAPDGDTASVTSWYTAQEYDAQSSIAYHPEEKGISWERAGRAGLPAPSRRQSSASSLNMPIFSRQGSTASVTTMGSPSSSPVRDAESSSSEPLPKTTANTGTSAKASSGEHVMAVIARMNEARAWSPSTEFSSNRSSATRQSLDDWATRGPDNERAARNEAAARIRAHASADAAKEPLDLSGLKLTAFPPEVPASAKTINFQGNSLREMPSIKDLPPRATLDLIGNPITGLPPDWQSVVSEVTIRFDPDSLPIETRITLEDRFDKISYVGPKFKYPDGVARNQAATQLIRSVSRWTDAESLAIGDWTAFRTEENSNSFATFLDRLRDVDLYKHASAEAAEAADAADADPAAGPPKALQAFRTRVVNLLQQLEADPDLRAACFGLAHDALGNCENRIALRLMDMETLCLDKRFEDEIKSGKYEHGGAQAVVDYCKSQFRRKLIAEAAYRKIENVREEGLHVETFLIFFNKFAEQYRLPVTMTGTPGNIVNVTDEEFAELARKLGNNTPGLTKEEKNANNQAFLKFLATSSTMNLLLDNIIDKGEMGRLREKIRETQAALKDELQDKALALMPQVPSTAELDFDEKMKKIQNEFLRVDDRVQEHFISWMIGNAAQNRGWKLNLDA